MLVIIFAGTFAKRDVFFRNKTIQTLTQLHYFLAVGLLLNRIGAWRLGFSFDQTLFNDVGLGFMFGGAFTTFAGIHWPTATLSSVILLMIAFPSHALDVLGLFVFSANILIAYFLRPLPRSSKPES